MTKFWTFRCILCLYVIIELIHNAAIFAENQNRHEICKFPPKWTIDGKDVMKEHVGNVTLVVLMELQCQFCRNQINR